MPRKARGQKITVAPGGPYGAGVESEDSQRAVPLAKAGDNIAHVSDTQPGTLGWEDPGDGRPLTHGSATGPGPGHEALAPLAQGTGNASETLTQIAHGPNSTPEIRSLLQAAINMGM